MPAPGIPDASIMCIRRGTRIRCRTVLAGIEHDHGTPSLLLRVGTAALAARKRLDCSQDAS